MIKTYGLTTSQPGGRGTRRRRYASTSRIFSVKEYFRDENSIQVQGPGKKMSSLLSDPITRVLLEASVASDFA